jgi:hypothetical protein
MLHYLKWFNCSAYAFRKWVQLVHIESLSYSLVSLYFSMSGKSSWVPSRTQGFIPVVVADGQMYYKYCINCLYPAMGDN